MVLVAGLGWWPEVALQSRNKSVEPTKQAEGEVRRRILRPITCSILAFVALAALCSDARAARAVPDDNLAYPVLITRQGGGQGSGFFLNLDGATFLVTARHVLFKPGTDDLLAPEAETLSYAKEPGDTGKNIIQLDLAALKQAGNIKGHPTHDVAVIRVGVPIPGSEPQALKSVAGVTVKETARSGILGVAQSSVKRFAEVLTANQVFIFGFPGSIGLKDLPQIDYLRPLLRAGVVAGTNERARTIILDCPAYRGNSGGPVIEVEEQGFLGKKFRIIGVVTEFVPVAETWPIAGASPHVTTTHISNSGYAVAIPMDFVLGLTSQF